MPSRPRNGGSMYRYRLYDSEGNEQGTAEYAVLIKPGELDLDG